jgi:hypothetical protein
MALILAKDLHRRARMMQSDQTFAYAYFTDERSATAAVRKLIATGFDSEQIGVLARDPKTQRPENVQLDHKTGIGPGAAIGTALGVAAGAAALPAAGVIALGGAFATLGGAAVGGATGTLMGVLGGLGIWKDEPAVSKKKKNESFGSRGVIVGTLTPTERAVSARAALGSAGARETKLATQAEAAKDLELWGALELPRTARNVNPDKLARNIFVLALVYVVAVAASIWLFIRPL